MEPLILETGERLEGQIKYYDYGVVSVVFELPLPATGTRWCGLGSRWVWDVDLRGACLPDRPAEAGTAPLRRWSSRTPRVVERGLLHLPRARNGGAPSGSGPGGDRGDRIAQIVRGETLHFRKASATEILQSRISYYPNDLAVIGWNAAFPLRQRRRRRNRHPVAGIRQFAACSNSATTTNC